MEVFLRLSHPTFAAEDTLAAVADLLGESEKLGFACWGVEIEPTPIEGLGAKKRAVDGKEIAHRAP